MQTFSVYVEKALQMIGAVNEANLCERIRNWYAAEDEPGIGALDRCHKRLKMREWLLDGINFGKFPPYGSHVKDIPIVLFEGLLIGIERRLQLYPFTKSGTYNARSIGSLDIENCFGSFQDIDQHGSGVLRVDDIPSALEVAMELFDSKMNPVWGFYMQTSVPKVYPERPIGRNENTLEETDMETDTGQDCICDLSQIKLRDHSFDIPDGKTKRKRKSGIISKPEEASKKPLPIREFHKACEANILPHVRRGLALKD